MNDQNSTLREVLVGLLVLAVVLAMGYTFFAGLVYLIQQMESQIAAAIVAASLSAIASVLAVIISKYFERRSRIKQEIRDKKTPVYENLIGAMFEFVFSQTADNRESLNEDELADIFQEMTPKLVVWGSQDVIRAWIHFREYEWESAKGLEILEPWESLMTAIRNDMGNKSDKLKNKELLRLFIKDIAQIRSRHEGE